MPKKYKRGFDQKITYDNMFKAYLNARKSKRCKKDVIKFNLRYEEKLLLICKKLKEGKYKFGKFKEFYVYDPKKRRILAAPFEDRIVHTWYVREFIEKIFVPQFISTSYACIKNKGMHRCALDVKKALYNVSKKNKNAYVIKMMVRLLGLICAIKSMNELSSELNTDESIGNIAKICEVDLKEIPHHDTINDVFKNIKVDEIEKIRDYLIKKLIRSKELSQFKVRDQYYHVVIDGTGVNVNIKINEEMKEKIKKKYLGKRALYTNRFEWSNEQIEATYSGSWHVEHGFRQMKDDKCISVKPMFHWKD